MYMENAKKVKESKSFKTEQSWKIRISKFKTLFNTLVISYIVTLQLHYSNQPQPSNCSTTQ